MEKVSKILGTFQCVDGCTNTNPNTKEEKIHLAVDYILSQIQFTEEEALKIEASSKNDMGAIIDMRNKEIDNLHGRRKKILGDLDYLTTNKITMLRTQAMTMEQIVGEEHRLKIALQQITEESSIHQDTTEEMLKALVTFSELVKMANACFKHALDIEKREIATTVFTELIITEEKVEYKLKEGFDALFKRHDWLSGSQGRIRTDDQLVNSELRYRCATREEYDIKFMILNLQSNCLKQNLPHGSINTINYFNIFVNIRLLFKIRNNILMHLTS